MRTKLFHTIVLCGAALGSVAGCSDGDEGERVETGGASGNHGCEHAGAGSGAGGSDGGLGGEASLGCGGWPTTK
jgi:hypothetical protein